MNNDRDRLLRDILAEPGEVDARRDALLHRTLRNVRRRRTIRRLRRAGSVLLLLPAMVLLVWWVQLPSRPQAVTRRLPYVLARTEPLSPSALIQTQPFAPSGVIATAPSLNVNSIATRPEDRRYHEIDDAALLALAGTNGAVLVRSGPHSAELVFASGTMTAHTTD